MSLSVAESVVVRYARATRSSSLRVYSSSLASVLLQECVLIAQLAYLDLSTLSGGSAPELHLRILTLLVHVPRLDPASPFPGLFLRCPAIFVRRIVLAWGSGDLFVEAHGVMPCRGRHGFGLTRDWKTATVHPSTATAEGARYR